MEKTKRIIVFIIVSVPVIFTITFLAIKSVQYDIATHKNWVTMLAGFWSAGATCVLGGIALWQNKNYKKQAEENNTRLEALTIMPECYLDSVSSEMKGDMFRADLTVIPEDPSYTKYLLSFTALNLHLFKFKIESINVFYKDKDKVITEIVKLRSYSSNISFLEPYRNFSVQTGVPKKIIQKNKDIEVKINFAYENIYQDQYLKEVKFDIKNISNKKDYATNMSTGKAARK